MATDLEEYVGLDPDDEEQKRQRASASAAAAPAVDSPQLQFHGPHVGSSFTPIGPSREPMLTSSFSAPTTLTAPTEVPVTPITLEDRLSKMRQAPRLQDYVPPEPHGLAKLGHFAAMLTPTTNAFFNTLPEKRGERRYGEAKQDWLQDVLTQRELSTDELAREREARETRRERSEETRPEREAAAREGEWQRHHSQEQQDLDRRFNQEQARWEKRQEETEVRQEDREKRAEGRQEERETRAEGRQEAKETRANRLKLQKTIDNARDIDGLEQEQTAILQQAQKNGQRGMFGGGPYLNGPQSMQFVANHMALTVGRIRGARTGRDLIQAHIDARDLDQTLEALAQRVLAGGVITYDQAQQMLGTTGVKRKSAWDRVWDESDDYKIDVSDSIPREFGGKGTPKGEEEKDEFEQFGGKKHP